jgi:hypothetical protein
MHLLVWVFPVPCIDEMSELVFSVKAAIKLIDSKFQGEIS